MSAPVEFMGAGIRVGSHTILIADIDGQVMVHVGDAACSAAIALPPEAARHIIKVMSRKVDQVEGAAAYPAEAEPRVPRRSGAPTDSAKSEGA